MVESLMNPLDIPDAEAMEYYNSRYFVINMTMLKFLGLWPFQKNLSRTIIRLFFSISIILSAIPQVIGAYVNRKYLDRCLQCIGTVCYVSGIGSKFFTMLYAEREIKMMYENMVRNWKILENQAEKNILVKHSEIGRLLTIGYLTYMAVAMFLFSCLPVAPRLVNMVSPMFNGSLIEMFILDGEYFLDKEKYYYYIYLIEIGSCLITLPMFSTIDSTYAVCVQQCVGLLNIVQLRLECATKQSKKFKSVGYQDKDVAYDMIAKTVQLHEKVLTFGRMLESSFSTNLFFILILNTCVLTTASVCILFSLDQPVKFFRYIFLTIGLSIHMFYLSWPGQKVIDASNGVFYAAYNNEWYNCSTRSQKLLMFIMRRTIEPMCLTAGGFYIMNFENFEMLMKTAVSYITVLSSFK